MNSGIYAIINIINDKMYVGSAIDIKNRCRKHKEKLKVNNHPNKYLQLSWNKYKENNFIFMTLEKVEKLNLLNREQIWIKQTKSYQKEFGYNSRQIPNSNIGLKFSDETKRKMSMAGKGHKRNLGQKRSEEYKKKLSEILKGRKQSEEHINKRRKYLKGRIISKEQRIKTSNTLKGNKNALGHSVSDEFKLSLSIRSRKLDKWPCPDGSKCICETCKLTRRLHKQAYYINEKHKVILI